MKFNIYRRFQVEIVRQDEEWIAHRAEAGKRVRMDELVVPPGLAADELAVYLDDLFHELAGIGQQGERVPDDNCSAARSS